MKDQPQNVFMLQLGFTDREFATAAPSVRLASLFTSDAAKEYPKPVVRSVEILNECLVAEICIDEYLWSTGKATEEWDRRRQ